MRLLRFKRNNKVGQIFIHIIKKAAGTPKILENMFKQKAFLQTIAAVYMVYYISVAIEKILRNIYCTLYLYTKGSQNILQPIKFGDTFFQNFTYTQQR